MSFCYARPLSLCVKHNFHIEPVRFFLVSINFFFIKPHSLLHLNRIVSLNLNCDLPLWVLDVNCNHCMCSVCIVHSITKSLHSIRCTFNAPSVMLMTCLAIELSPAPTSQGVTVSVFMGSMVKMGPWRSVSSFSLPRCGWLPGGRLHGSSSSCPVSWHIWELSTSSTPPTPDPASSMHHMARL